MKLYHLGKMGDGWGWGVCNTNLKEALREFFDVCEYPSYQSRFDGVAFLPTGGDFSLPRHIEPEILIGYCFIEGPIPEDAAENAKAFDWIFAGSNWCADRLKAAGIHHCSALVQGIDSSVFKPQPWPNNKELFIVYSGGKYEFRKGQDYVIAAMRHFMGANPEVRLVTNWHNHWPETAATMKNSWLLKNWTDKSEGLKPERVFHRPPAPNRDMPKIYATTHVGLFPNRCEAGTNLAMMEYMACGRPVIATNATGHRDVLKGDGPITIDKGDIDPAGWFNPTVSDVIVGLEKALADWKAGNLEERGRKCADLISPWTWRRAAETVSKQVQSLLKQRGS